jgi:hypothetical protein
MSFSDPKGWFHTSDGVSLCSSTDPERDLLQPAVNGVKNVLSSVAKAKNRPASPFKRLILTSSTGRGSTQLDSLL